MGKRIEVKCPAAELCHGAMSLNKQDVRCNITGLMRDAKKAPCVGEYAKCGIWRKEKQRAWDNKEANKTTKVITHDGWKDA